MIVICKPEESMQIYNELQQITIDVFTGLGLPIRVLAICSGDLGDLKHVQVDIEAYSPRRKDYFEVGSCSNLVDAQARQLGIKIDTKEGKILAHTLNNTAIATSRALVAILENSQTKDGKVKIPQVLQAYMGGKEYLG
jgi:seryl-tRNA synthetase